MRKFIDYSDLYKEMQEKVKNLPAWKIDLYNQIVAISSHAKKINKNKLKENNAKGVKI